MYNYEVYCNIITNAFGEELERMEEFIYSIKNKYDCSGDKYWVKEPPCDIPSYEEVKIIYEKAGKITIEDTHEDYLDRLRSLWMEM